MIDLERIRKTETTNEFIAGFMGNDCDVALLRYHAEWNWLMPVCRKIGEIVMDDRRTRSLKYWKRSIDFELSKKDIDKVYTEVVLFLMWYNVNK